MLLSPTIANAAANRKWLVLLAESAELPLSVYAAQLSSPKALAGEIGAYMLRNGRALARMYVQEYLQSNSLPEQGKQLDEAIAFALFEKEREAIDARRVEDERRQMEAAIREREIRQRLRGA